VPCQGQNLDAHINDFKKQIYFRPSDIVLDPFCRSGTLVVQKNELGIPAVAVDISEFSGSRYYRGNNENRFTGEG
jgi:hypothetical protein